MKDEIDLSNLSDIVLEEKCKSSCTCHQRRKHCVNYDTYTKKCNALWKSMFFKIDRTTHKKMMRMCPFYKVDDSYQYAVIDELEHEVVDFFKNIEDARTCVKVYSGNYYASGLDDERFKIKKWKGELYKLWIHKN